jgi:hypothetical protein
MSELTILANLCIHLGSGLGTKILVVLVPWLLVAAILAAAIVLRRNFAHSNRLVAEDKAKELLAQVYGSDQPSSD